MSKWQQTTLGKVLGDGGGKIQTGPFGSQLHASDYVDSGIPCIMPANMKNNRVNLLGIAFIAEKDAQRLSHHLVKEGDIVYSRRGDVTQKALIGKTEVGYFCGTGCLLVRPGDAIDPEFLTYHLSTPSNQTLNLPPKKETQKKVAAVLSALDAKIDCNNRINAELEAMAKTLYDYWFVQFDFPDANGKPYKSSGGKMGYNATLKQEIPVGWEARKLGQYISLERGVTYGKEDVCTSNTKDAVGVLRATNVTANVIDTDDLVYVPDSKLSLAQTMTKFSTLIVMSSGSKEHVGKNGIYLFDEPLGFGAFCSKITSDINSRYFVNTFLQSKWFRAYIKNQCLGTNINNLTNDHINNCPTIGADPRVSRLFEETLKAHYEKMAVNAVENRSLKQLRDWLLPLLMNGQVTVA
ncbi:restriction endonuclease subunit S [Azonexus sp.]|uniref:restriction endonuclease subunit S n=1 Tax=Azonexus sp. TaxID=1872668 RepID=UPI0035B0E5E7